MPAPRNSRPQHGDAGHKRGPLTLFPPCKESCFPAALWHAVGRSNTPAAKTPLPLLSAGTASTWRSNHSARFFLPAKARKGRNSHSTTVRAIKPLLSNYHISLHQRLGDVKPKLYYNARLGGGLLMLEACLIAPSNMVRAFCSLGKSTASHHLSPSSQAEGDSLGSRARSCLRWASSLGTAKKKKIKETPYIFL